MGGSATGSDYEYEPWFHWAVRVIYIEMGIAIAVTLYALYSAMTGSGGFG